MPCEQLLDSSTIVRGRQGMEWHCLRVSTSFGQPDTRAAMWPSLPAHAQVSGEHASPLTSGRSLSAASWKQLSLVSPKKPGKKFDYLRHTISIYFLASLVAFFVVWTLEDINISFCTFFSCCIIFPLWRIIVRETLSG